ncbi:hypothetical protein AB0L75_43665 [Streptomyces sp. NPDC052101]|uniref:hypothetical protein n=1 Tax=Streptomyces sp. NPDC052101 TaxID=3155763 RepID=UPI00342AC651
MTSDARARLSEAFNLCGSNGMGLVFHDPDDPLGTTAEGADAPPHSDVGRSSLRERVAEANARSRGEIL